MLTSRSYKNGKKTVRGLWSIYLEPDLLGLSMNSSFDRLGCTLYLMSYAMKAKKPHTTTHRPVTKYNSPDMSDGPNLRVLYDEVGSNLVCGGAHAGLPPLSYC